MIEKVHTDVRCSRCQVALQALIVVVENCVLGSAVAVEEEMVLKRSEMTCKVKDKGDDNC